VRRLVKLRDRYVVWNVTTETPASGLLTREEVWERAQRFFGQRLRAPSPARTHVTSLLWNADAYGCSAGDTAAQAIASTGLTVEALYAKLANAS
jgi:hypothetical protein